MDEIDFINTKNKIQILILRIEKKYEGKQIPERVNLSLEAMYGALNLIMTQDNRLQILKNEIISIKLNNVKAYKEMAELKNKLK
tara:strand:+ start:6472 stop:6723 length:252 start_codon:yes stop_codon:yes gene_type:complete